MAKNKELVKNDSPLDDVEPKNTEVKGDSSLDDILTDTVTDVAEPSPVADMPPVENGEPSVDRAQASPDLAAGVAGDTAAKKRRGRPPKNGTAPRPKLEGVKSGVTPPVDIQNAGIEPCAELCVGLVSLSGMMLGGEQAAIKPDEAMLAKNGFVAYFKAKGVDSVPPWVMVAGGLAPYYIRILGTTPAKTTLANASGRVWYRIKEFLKERKNARFNRRYDTERKNDISEKTSESSL